MFKNTEERAIPFFFSSNFETHVLYKKESIETARPHGWGSNLINQGMDFRNTVSVKTINKKNIEKYDRL